MALASRLALGLRALPPSRPGGDQIPTTSSILHRPRHSRYRILDAVLTRSPVRIPLPSLPPGEHKTINDILQENGV